MNYGTIKVRFQDSICFLQFYRPEANNTINNLLIKECNQVLELYKDSINVLVLEGLPEVFCFGADFNEARSNFINGREEEQDPEALYDLWLKLATGAFITISNVKGKVNAGGMGFIAASDIVFADSTAQFSLSELLFGLFPACVLPFLIRRVGFQKANYLTLTTQAISGRQASEWGLVDVFDDQSDLLLRRQLLRLKRLSKISILNYKNYIKELDNSLFKYKSLAVNLNKRMFSDSDNLKSILKYVEEGKFPWED